MRWFRFYDEVLNDPKVQRLAPDLFKAWVNLLCLASRTGGVIPCVEDSAFALRIDEPAMAAALSRLSAAGLIDTDDDGVMHPHGWASRQYDSDSSAERMRRHRSKHGDVTGTVTVTSHAPSQRRHGDAPEQIQNRTDTDTEKSARKRAPAVEISEDRLPESLRIPEFVAVWRDWERHRREKRAALTASTVRDQLKLCESLGPARAARMIRASITNGWQGLFERNADGNAPGGSRPSASLPTAEELAQSYGVKL